jgi:preprotein translocase subunit SecF
MIFNIYQKQYNFLLHYKKFIFLSLILIICSFLLFFFKGLNLGIDFKGGTVIEVKLEQKVSTEKIRSNLVKYNLGDTKVKEFGSDKEFLIIFEKKGTDNNFIENMKSSLEKDLSTKLNFRRVEVVGPKVSDELSKAGSYAVLLSIVLMLIYIWFRFEWQFGLGSVIALFHDVALTIGVFSLLSFEFNLSIIAAILTIVGYSMNDTVVIYDRIRENLKKDDKMNLQELINNSINETLSRTLKTSGTTLLALIAIYFFGGEILKGFSFAMIWGVVVGTYSSIYIASPFILLTNIKRDWNEVIDSTP